MSIYQVSVNAHNLRPSSEKNTHPYLEENSCHHTEQKAGWQSSRTFCLDAPNAGLNRTVLLRTAVKRVFRRKGMTKIENAGEEYADSSVDT